MGLARMIWESCSSYVEEERREKGRKGGEKRKEGGKRREKKGGRDNIPMLAMDKLQYAVPMT